MTNDVELRVLIEAAKPMERAALPRLRRIARNKAGLRICKDRYSGSLPLPDHYYFTLVGDDAPLKLGSKSLSLTFDQLQEIVEAWA